MLGRIKETDLSRPLPRGRLLLLLAHRGGEAVPDPLPQEGRASTPPEEVMLDLNELAEGPQVHVARRLRGERRRQPARLLDRHHRLPRVHAARQGPAHRRAPARSAIEKTGSVAWAADNRTLFYTVEDDAKRPYRLYRHASARRRRTRSSTRRRTSSSASASGARAAASYLVLGVGQPHHQRGARACPPTSPTASGRLIAPREPGPRVRRRPPRRPLLHPHQRHGPQLPAGDGAGRRDPAARTGRRSSRTGRT